MKTKQLFISLILVSSNLFALETLSIQKQFNTLENSAGGRIGISAIDTNNNQKIQFRSDERFAFCSTFKVMAVSAILNKSMKEKNFLDKKINYSQKDMVSYSPVTEKHIADGMTIADLSAAAITMSDNTAVNLLMKQIGGPSAVTRFARSIGDKEFTLNRWEPELNTAIPGDKRDTTTPDAMQNSLQHLVLGNTLSAMQRDQLQLWLKSNTTGNERIRVAIPSGWVVGDKTGTGDYGTTNDIAVIWPPKCSPVVMVVYYTQNKKDAAPKSDVIASAARIVMNEFSKTDQCIKLN